VDQDKRWEILNEIIQCIESNDWHAWPGSFLVRHEYLVLEEYPIAVISDPNVRIAGVARPLPVMGNQTLLTIKGRELERKLTSSTERILAIKELSDLIDKDKIYEETNDNG
jgi:hypothetical protein